jgi:hypothetical protein
MFQGQNVGILYVATSACIAMAVSWLRRIVTNFPMYGFGLGIFLNTLVCHVSIPPGASTVGPFAAAFPGTQCQPSATTT